MRVLFFADRLPPLIGGVEVHAKYFIEYFNKHPNYSLTIVSKDIKGNDVLIKDKKKKCPVNFNDLNSMSFDIVFFNSGAWIEQLVCLKKILNSAKFIYRTGGNEIVKAPLVSLNMLSHKTRQSFWAKQINEAIDIVITNSEFTELRLKQIGITTCFKRLIGGASFERKLQSHHNERITFVCAARLVPYKNHLLLLKVFKLLCEMGCNYTLKIYGDGELSSEIKEKINAYQLESYVQLFPPLEHAKLSQEIANADFYIQLSQDLVRKVPGGSYIHTEGMGRSIMEAIMSNTFVIAGSCGALSEIIHEKNGVLVDLSDINNIASTIKKLGDSPPLLHNQEDYSWTSLFLHYEKMFEKLCVS